MAKSKEMILARKLRKNGESIKQIAVKLRVSVSSASIWCRNIQLSEEQMKTLEKRRTDVFYGKRMMYIQNKKKEFDKAVHTLKEEGIKEVGKMSNRDILIAGIALYWGEGFKKDHSVGMATSDPDAAKFFIMWLHRCFQYSPKDLILRVTLNSACKDMTEKIHKFWSQSLAIPFEQFSKPYFQKTKWKKQYENREDYHGVIRIKVRKSISSLRKIYGYIEGIRRLV